MSGVKKANKEVTVFIRLLDRGFNLSVPADQEELYIKSYNNFLERFEMYKSGEKKYDDFEAIALAAIESMVSAERNEEQMKQLIEMLEHRVHDLDGILTTAMTTKHSSK